MVNQSLLESSHDTRIHPHPEYQSGGYLFPLIIRPSLIFLTLCTFLASDPTFHTVSDEGSGPRNIVCVGR
ncbi:hypothetical protein IWW34DRAFT_725496, partial [Fusarium oxysporum f. sp. albedinis]